MITSKKIGNKIKLLRKNLGLSQAELAKKMNFSRVTITHIEAGKRDLEALELIKFSKIFNLNPASFLRDEEASNASSKKITKSQSFSLSPEKLKNLILYILEKCGGKPNVGETVLYKLLYFCDFDSYEMNGQPITGMNYVKLQFGPVPRAKEYGPVVDVMIDSNELKIITQEYHGMIQKRYIALKESDKSTLDEKEKNIINEIILKYSDMSARGIENFVHGDAPWRETDNQEIINYNLVFNRVPPYSHNDYDADFLQAGQNDVLENLGSISKEEHNYYNSL
jgi:transcriptional regulator with XRE-family HTH domain